MGWNKYLRTSRKLRLVSTQRPNKQKSNVLPGTVLQRRGLAFALFASFSVLHESSTGREDGVDRGDVDAMAVGREGRRIQREVKYSRDCLNA